MKNLKKLLESITTIHGDAGARIIKSWDAVLNNPENSEDDTLLIGKVLRAIADDYSAGQTKVVKP